MIINIGSINADMFYRVAHLPTPGETVLCANTDRGLGGKGANMSVAAARAGSQVFHAGAVGEDGQWALARLTDFGVDTHFVRLRDAPTGHAIVVVDQSGENQIIVSPGANVTLTKADIQDALGDARRGDILLLQNETNLQAYAAELASSKRLRVVYAAAPFSAEAVRGTARYADYLVLNEHEASQFAEETGEQIEQLDVGDVIITRGADGCDHIDNREATRLQYPGFKVAAADTTGAGDTFTGYFAAGLDRGLSVGQAISQAQMAAAIMVTRQGTADVIPFFEELETFEL